MTESPQPVARKGTTVDASDPERLRQAIELALDYRGDVTVTRRSTGTKVDGYLFDRTSSAGTAAVRIIPADGSERVTIPCDDISELAFSGRDTAEGKSFDTWMKKYVEKKLAGEQASIESEVLD